MASLFKKKKKFSVAKGFEPGTFASEASILTVGVFNTLQQTDISGSFPQKRKFRSSCWKGRESNRDIERKYIRPRIRSYSYILPLAGAIFGQLTNDSYSIHSYIYGICTHHFFVKMTSHCFANKPKLYLDGILI